MEDEVLGVLRVRQEHLHVSHLIGNHLSIGQGILNALEGTSESSKVVRQGSFHILQVIQLLKKIDHLDQSDV